MSAAAAFGRPLSSPLPTPPLAAADDDADSWPARRRSLLAQRRQLATDDGVVVQRVALDRDAVAVAFEVVQLHEFAGDQVLRSEEHTSELQSLMRISYAVFCLKKNTKNTTINK